MAKYITGLTTEEWDMIFAGDPTPLLDETGTVELENVTGANFSHIFLTSDKIKNIIETNSKDYALSTKLTCPNIESIKLDNATSVPANFLRSSTIITVDLPKVVNLGEWSFNGCQNLKSINLPELKTIDGEYVFTNCESLTEINLPELKTIDGQYIFRTCSSLIEINLPELTSTGIGTFYICTNLTSVDLPKLTTAGDYVFYNCENLISVSLPSLKTAGTSFFGSCKSLVSINLPSLETAGDNFWDSCTSIEEVILPKLTTIGATPFNGAGETLKRLYLLAPQVVTLTGKLDTMTSCPYLTIYVPENLVADYQAHSIWSQYNIAPYVEGE